MKFIASIAIVLLLSGCQTLETYYQAGEVIGKHTLSEKDKEKLSPYNEAAKDSYKLLKAGKPEQAAE